MAKTKQPTSRSERTTPRPTRPGSSSVRRDPALLAKLFTFRQINEQTYGPFLPINIDYPINKSRELAEQVLTSQIATLNLNRHGMLNPISALKFKPPKGYEQQKRFEREKREWQEAKSIFLDEIALTEGRMLYLRNHPNGAYGNPENTRFLQQLDRQRFGLQQL
jgi:hypothetical protein